MEPLVSVCIPAYNNAEYIKDTIDSILNQTYQKIELVIVDDNSKDNTYELIREIGDERIKLYHNDKNLGMSGNWNRCLSLCTGKYAKLVCADDILSPDALKREVDALEANPSAVIAESDTKLIDLNGKGKGFYKRYKKSGLVDGKEVTMQVKAGDKVIYSKYAGNEVKLGDEEYIIVKQSDILAVVE